MAERFDHPLEPWGNEQARVLILGSFPSPQSRHTNSYYGHPQNRFWVVLAALCHESVPRDVIERQAFVIRHRIALWDVISSCTIAGASDASIRDAQANDLTPLLEGTSIQAIFTTGRTATDLFRRLITPVLGWHSQYLPSTSPANQGRWPLPKLIDAYRIICPYLHQ